MVDVTLFEIHLDGAEFTANAPGSGLGVGQSGESGKSGESTSSGGPNLFPAVLGVLALVVVAVVLRRVVGGSGEPEE